MPLIHKSMEKRLVKQNFDSVVNLGFKNLVVGGCSFTHTIAGISVPTTWP